MNALHLSPAPMSGAQTPQQVVDEITAAARSSFSLGMKLLSRPRREAMRAVYAFCRVVDDIADGEMTPQDKKELLEDWRHEVDLIYKGAPRSAIGSALERPIMAYGLPKAEFLAMIEGMEMDAAGPILAPSQEDLARYTRCVAGSVGMLSMRIFGAWRGDVSERFALGLADALQLTNILRDVEEDAAIGRIYLPDWALADAGITANPVTIAAAPGLAAARAAVGEIARTNFKTAKSLIPEHPRRNLIPALAMLGVYQGYFDKLEGANWSPSHPVKIGKLRKLWLGLHAVLFAGPVK